MVKSNGVRTGRSKWPLVGITGIAFALAGLAAAQQPTEIIVRNGLIVTAEGRMEADVRIVSGARRSCEAAQRCSRRITIS